MTPLTTAASNEAGAAITELLEREGPLLYALARQMSRNQQDAEDLMQVTFLNAYRAWNQLADRGNPRPWLFTIAAAHSPPTVRRAPFPCR